MASNSSYYIYIKNIKQENRKTTPKAPSDYGGDSNKGDGGTKPKPPNDGDDRERVPSYVPYSRQMNTVGRLFSSGTSGFSKATIALAIIIKTLKIAEQTTTAINNYVSVQTGDYTSKLKWDNIDRTIKNVTSPISSSVGAFLAQEAWERSDLAKDEQRTLLGDTQINTLTKGV